MSNSISNKFWYIVSGLDIQVEQLQNGNPVNQFQGNLVDEGWYQLTAVLNFGVFN